MMVPGVTTRTTLRGKDALDGLLAHLLADGDVIAFLDEPGEVVVDGVIGNAGQRRPDPLANRSRGQDDIEFARSDFCVLVEGLVEVPQAEKEYCARILAFDLQVLLPNRRDIFGHGCYSMGKAWPNGKGGTL